MGGGGKPRELQVSLDSSEASDVQDELQLNANLSKCLTCKQRVSYVNTVI